MPVLAIALLLRGIGFALMWIADVLRRIRGAYRTGYALVDDETTVGQILSFETPFLMSRSPVFLPPGAGELPVAILRDASGIRSTFRDHGVVWAARSACVAEILPAWTGLGSNGELAIATIHHAANAPADRIRNAPMPVIGDKELIADDVRRAWLLRSLTQLADWYVRGRLRYEVLGDPPKALSDDELARQMAGRDHVGWIATRRVATVAALAAAFIEELPPRTVDAWSRPYVDLTMTREPTRPSSAFAARAARTLGDLMDLIGRWPMPSAALTALALLIVLLVNPVVGILAFFVITGGAAAAVLRSRRRRSPEWRPHNGSLDIPASRAKIQQAMAGLASTSNPLYAMWLQVLLPKSRIWVAIDAPEPTDPSRWLSWLDRTGERVPILVLDLPDGRRGCVAFTSSTGHEPLNQALHIHWTLELNWARVTELARAAGSSVVIVDPGQPRSVESELSPMRAAE